MLVLLFLFCPLNETIHDLLVSKFRLVTAFCRKKEISLLADLKSYCILLLIWRETNYFSFISVISSGPFAVVDEHFNSILPNCYDAIGLMLMIRIIHQHQVKIFP